MTGLCRPYFSPLGVGEINKAQIASKQKTMGAAAPTLYTQQQAYKELHLEVSHGICFSLQDSFQLVNFVFSRGHFQTRLVTINL